MVGAGLAFQCAMAEWALVQIVAHEGRISAVHLSVFLAELRAPLGSISPTEFGRSRSYYRRCPGPRCPRRHRVPILPHVLASGPIAGSGDAISIELHQPNSHACHGRAVWATAPTITTPARYNEASSAAMQLLAEASTVFTTFKASKRL